MFLFQRASRSLSAPYDLFIVVFFLLECLLERTGNFEPEYKAMWVTHPSRSWRLLSTAMFVLGVKVSRAPRSKGRRGRQERPGLNNG